MNYFLWAISLSFLTNFCAVAMEMTTSGALVTPWSPSMRMKEHNFIPCEEQRSISPQRQRPQNSGMARAMEKFAADEEAARIIRTKFRTKEYQPVFAATDFNKAVNERDVEKVEWTLKNDKELVKNYRPARLLNAVYANKADGIFLWPSDMQVIQRDSLEYVAYFLADKGNNLGFIMMYSMRDTFSGVEKIFNNRRGDIMRSSTQFSSESDEEDFT